MNELTEAIKIIDKKIVECCKHSTTFPLAEETLKALVSLSAHLESMIEWDAEVVRFISHF